MAGLNSSAVPQDVGPDGECVLIQSWFAASVQLALGVITIGTLVFKWFWVESGRSRRKYYDFRSDLLKQAVGATWLHGLNVALAGPLADAASGDECEWYFLETTMGCTIGTFLIVYFNRASSDILRSILGDKAKNWVTEGDYTHSGVEFNTTRRMKDLVIFVFFCCTASKLLTTLFLMIFSDDLTWIAQLLLSPFSDKPEMKVFVVLALVPFPLNILQYWFIDSRIAPEAVRSKVLSRSLTDPARRLGRLAEPAAFGHSKTVPLAPRAKAAPAPYLASVALPEEKPDLSEPLIPKEPEPKPRPSAPAVLVHVHDCKGEENEDIVDHVFHTVPLGELNEEAFVQFAQRDNVAAPMGLEQFEEEDMRQFFKQFARRGSITKDRLQAVMRKQRLMVEVYRAFDRDGGGEVSIGEFKKFGALFFQPPTNLGTSLGSVVQQEFQRSPADIFGAPDIFSTGGGKYRVLHKVHVEEHAQSYEGMLKNINPAEYWRKKYDVGAIVDISHIVVPKPQQVVRGYVVAAAQHSQTEVEDVPSGWINLWTLNDGQRWCMPVDEKADLQALELKAGEDWKTLQRLFETIHPNSRSAANSKEWSKFLHQRLFGDDEP